MLPTELNSQAFHCPLVKGDCAFFPMSECLFFCSCRILSCEPQDRFDWKYSWLSFGAEVLKVGPVGQYWPAKLFDLANYQLPWLLGCYLLSSYVETLYFQLQSLQPLVQWLHKAVVQIVFDRGAYSNLSLDYIKIKREIQVITRYI